MKTPAESTLNHIAELMYPVRNYRQYLEALVSSSEYVVFYGCGTIFHSIFQVWNDHISHKIDFVCDSNPQKWGTLIHGVRCISPAELFEMKDRCTVFISIGGFMPVRTLLLENGISRIGLFYKYDLLNHMAWDGGDWEFVQSSLAATYELLADEKSRLLFDALARRFFRQESAPEAMSRFHDPDQYFPGGPIPLSEHECVADIGAFDGDTLRDFVRKTGNRFERYDAFELCRENCRKLRETAAAIPDGGRIRAFNCGVGDRRETITYHAAQSESRIGGGETGMLDTLDNLLPVEKVTLIKMDIEGYEMKALKGAEQTIRKWKPTLAICIYHDLRHWWEVPLYIKSLVPEYRIYLRHHGPLEYETVCYAVCN